MNNLYGRMATIIIITIILLLKQLLVCVIK